MNEITSLYQLNKEEGNGPIDSQAMVMITCLIKIRNLYCPDFSVHITYKGQIDGLRRHGGLQTASISQRLKFVISNLNYPEIHVHIGPNCHIGGL